MSTRITDKAFLDWLRSCIRQAHGATMVTREGEYHKARGAMYAFQAALYKVLGSDAYKDQRDRRLLNLEAGVRGPQDRQGTDNPDPDYREIASRA